MDQHKSELRDGMRVEWDVPIPMQDGVVLRADVFRPASDGRYPVIMSHGRYAKGLAFQDGFPGPWKILAAKYPEVLAGSSGKYQNWETADPEKWVPDGPGGWCCWRVRRRRRMLSCWSCATRWRCCGGRTQGQSWTGLAHCGSYFRRSGWLTSKGSDGRRFTGRFGPMLVEGPQLAGISRDCDALSRSPLVCQASPWPRSECG